MKIAYAVSAQNHIIMCFGKRIVIFGDTLKQCGSEFNWWPEFALEIGSVLVGSTTTRSSLNSIFVIDTRQSVIND